MRIALISDFHLAPGALNRCSSDPARLASHIEGLLASHDHVVVVGDAYDLLRPARWRGWREHLKHIQREFGPFVCSNRALPVGVGQPRRAS